MKRWIFPVVAGFVLVACGTNNSSNTPQEIVNVENAPEFESTKYDLVDLTEFGIEAQIQVPNKTVTNVAPAVQLNETSGVLQVSSGEKFKLNIIETEMDKGLVKSDLEGDLLFTNKIEEEEENFIKYTSSLPDGSKSFTHFCAWLDINGTTYLVENDKHVKFSDHYLNRMIKCVKSIQRNNSI